MDCHSTLEETILIFPMKKNVRYIFPLTNSFQKKCPIKCWAHKFVFKVEKIQSSGFFLVSRKKRLIDRLIKKIKKEKSIIETKLIK